MRLKHGRERGQVLPLATILIVFLLSMVGFGIETGSAFFVGQVAHAAAESAAMATVLAAMSSVNGTSVTCGSGSAGTQCSTTATICSALPNSPPKTNIDNGCLFAKQNGFVAGGSTTIKITADNTGAAPGNPNVAVMYWAQATVTTRQPQLFSAIFSKSGMFAGATATAAIVSSGAPSGCIYALNHSAQRAMDVEGAEVQASCGIYINSNNSAALYIGGNPPGGAGTPAISSSSVSIVGNYQNAGQGTIVPTPLTSQTAVADPLASLPEPAVGSSCTYTNYNWSQGSTSLSPGTYCGGIHISGGAVTFSAGQYILNGGGLTIDSAGATASGSGVTFYNTSSSSFAYGPLTISGQPNVTFSAPASGTYEGIFFFTDRAQTSTSQNQINGATNASIQGTFYMPTVPLLYTGESSTGSYTGIVVSTLEINGNVTFKQDTTGQFTGLSAGGASAFLIQ
jgi:hypothetical protein